MKKQNAAENAMQNNDLETVQDLMDMRQEVLQLRSANNALEFAIQQKDEMIMRLKGDADRDSKNKGNNLDMDEKVMRLHEANAKLQDRLDSLQLKNAELEDKCA